MFKKIAVLLLLVLTVGACSKFSKEVKDLTHLDPPNYAQFCITGLPEQVYITEDSIHHYRQVQNHCSLIVKQIAYSIATEPSLWKTDGFTLTRADGPSVWVANGEEGINVGPTESSIARHRTRNAHERNLLWCVYKQWEESNIARGKAASSVYKDND